MINQEDNFDPDILDPEDIYVTVDLEDGSEMECSIVAIFEAEGQDYIALYAEDGRYDDNVLLYRYFEDEEGTPSLEYIDNDAEFDMASAAFNELPEAED